MYQRIPPGNASSDGTSLRTRRTDYFRQWIGICLEMRASLQTRPKTDFQTWQCQFGGKIGSRFSLRSEIGMLSLELRHVVVQQATLLYICIFSGVSELGCAVLTFVKGFLIVSSNELVLPFKLRPIVDRGKSNESRWLGV